MVWGTSGIGSGSVPVKMRESAKFSGMDAVSRESETQPLPPKLYNLPEL